MGIIKQALDKVDALAAELGGLAELAAIVELKLMGSEKPQAGRWRPAKLEILTPAPEPNRRARRAAKAGKRAAAKKPADPKTAKPKTEKAPKANGGRKPRATEEEMAKRKADVVAAFPKLPVPFAKADVMKLVPDVESRTLALLVKDGKLTQKGEKKNTKYWVKAA